MGEIGIKFPRTTSSICQKQSVYSNRLSNTALEVFTMDRDAVRLSQHLAKPHSVALALVALHRCGQDRQVSVVRSTKMQAESIVHIETMNLNQNVYFL